MTASDHSHAKAQAELAQYARAYKETPETTLAEMFKRDLGIEVNPQALRIFIRVRWDRLSPLAHAIHRGDT